MTTVATAMVGRTQWSYRRSTGSATTTTRPDRPSGTNSATRSARRRTSTSRRTPTPGSTTSRSSRATSRSSGRSSASATSASTTSRRQFRRCRRGPGDGLRRPPAGARRTPPGGERAVRGLKRAPRGSMAATTHNTQYQCDAARCSRTSSVLTTSPYLASMSKRFARWGPSARSPTASPGTIVR